MKQIAFIVNSTIKKLKPKIKAIQVAFEEKDYKLTFYFSEKSRHIEDLCLQAIEEGKQYFIFVGGDGTLNEGINGLLTSVRVRQDNQLSDYNLPVLKRYRVGVLPFGSGNDFAKTIGQNKDVFSLKQKIENDICRTVDIGYMHYCDENKQPATRFFINISDIGIGGVVTQKIIHKNTALNPDWLYFRAIFTGLMTYKNQKIRFQSETEEWEDKIKSLVFANGRYFGSGMGIAPNAKLDSGHFEIIKMGDISIWDYLKHLQNLRKLRLIQHPKVKYSQAKTLSIEPLGKQNLPIDMDGEFIGYAPISLVCIPQAIWFIG